MENFSEISLINAQRALAKDNLILKTPSTKPANKPIFQNNLKVWRYDQHKSPPHINKIRIIIPNTFISAFNMKIHPSVTIPYILNKFTC